MSTAQTNEPVTPRVLLAEIAGSPLPTPSTVSIGEVVFLHLDSLADLRAWAVATGCREFETRVLKQGRLFSYWPFGQIKGVPLVLTASEPVEVTDEPMAVA